MQSESSRYSLVSQKYWCHNCSQQFSLMRNTEDLNSREVLCQNCNSVCELVNGQSNQNHPGNFRIFDNQQPEQPPRPNNQNTHFSFFFPLQEIILISRPNQQAQAQAQSQNTQNNQNHVFIHFMESPVFALEAELQRRLHLMRLVEEYLRAHGQENHGAPPAEKEVINQLKEIVIEEKDVEGIKGKPCPVCQEDFQAKEIGKELKCKHLFHKQCIEPWLNMHRTCPCCRQEVL